MADNVVKIATSNVKRLWTRSDGMKMLIRPYSTTQTAPSVVWAVQRRRGSLPLALKALRQRR